MGKRGHLPPHLWKCGEVFYALVVTTKRSADELFMQYFHNPLSVSAESPQTLTRIHPWTLLGDFRFQTHNLSTPGKKPASAHAQQAIIMQLLLVSSLTLALSRHMSDSRTGPCRVTQL